MFHFGKTPMSAETLMPQNARVNKCCMLWRDKKFKSVMNNRNDFAGNTATSRNTVDIVSSMPYFFPWSYNFNFTISSVIYEGSLSLCCGCLETTISQ